MKFVHVVVLLAMPSRLHQGIACANCSEVSQLGPLNTYFQGHFSGMSPHLIIAVRVRPWAKTSGGLAVRRTGLGQLWSGYMASDVYIPSYPLRMLVLPIFFKFSLQSGPSLRWTIGLVCWYFGNGRFEHRCCRFSRNITKVTSKSIYFCYPKYGTKKKHILDQSIQKWINFILKKTSLLSMQEAFGLQYISLSCILKPVTYTVNVHYWHQN